MRPVVLHISMVSTAGAPMSRLHVLSKWVGRVQGQRKPRSAVSLSNDGCSPAKFALHSSFNSTARNTGAGLTATWSGFVSTRPLTTGKAGAARRAKRKAPAAEA